MIGEPVRGSILVGLEERTLEPSSRCGDLLAGTLPTSIRVSITMRRMNDLPRTVGLQQGVLRGPHHGRRFPRYHVRIPWVHSAHVRVHQAVVVIDVGVRIVLDEIEALLSTTVVLHRFAKLIKAQIPRAIYDASVCQIRAVVVLVELTHRTLLLLRQADGFPSLVEANVSLAFLREDVQLPTEVLGLSRKFLVRGIMIIASQGLDRAASYGNIAAAASRIETHGAHHCRHRPAHHHHQEAQNLR